MKHSKLQRALTTVWMYYGTEVTTKALASSDNSYPTCAFRTTQQQRQARAAWTHLQRTLERSAP